MTNIIVSPAKVTVIEGGTLTFTAATLDQFGNPIAATVTWSSSDTNVGTIDPATGVFTAIKPGDTTITAASGSVSGTAKAHVSNVPPKLTKIIVSPPYVTLFVGGTQSFTAATLDQFDNPIAAAVIWSSSNPTVGTINSNSGLFTALAVGTTTVTAASGDVTSSGSTASVIPIPTVVNVSYNITNATTVNNPSFTLGCDNNYILAIILYRCYSFLAII